MTDRDRVIAEMERQACRGCAAGIPARHGIHWVDLYDKRTGEIVRIERVDCEAQP